jgi:hypothetical protein
MELQLAPAFARHCCAGARRDAIGRHVEGDVAIQRRDLALRIRVPGRERRCAHLLLAPAAVLEVEGPPELRHPERRQFSLRRTVLPQVVVLAFALEHEHAHGKHTITPAQRIGSVIQNTRRIVGIGTGQSAGASEKETKQSRAAKHGHLAEGRSQSVQDRSRGPIVNGQPL